MDIKQIVYRVQDSDGRGPFKPGFTKTWIMTRADHDNLPPWYVEFGASAGDVAVSGSGFIGSGCASEKQLRRWFNESEYAVLRKHGYSAVKIEVDRVLAASEIQLVFERVKPLNEDIEVIKLY